MSGCPGWFAESLAWKPAGSKASRGICQELFGRALGPNLADLNSRPSTQIAGDVYWALDIPEDRETTFDIGSLEGGPDFAVQEDLSADDVEKPVRSAGTRLEEGLRKDIEKHLLSIDPRRGWTVERKGDVADFEQYKHMKLVRDFRKKDATFRQLSGHSYLVKTDVRVGVPNPDPSRLPLLHACVSSKLTIRSDRAQNVKAEFDVLSRIKNGRQPHFTVVTAEPLPSRLASIAEGYGALDAMYHLLYEEVDEALRRLSKKAGSKLAKQMEDWEVLTGSGRIRPYGLLAQTFATS